MEENASDFKDKIINFLRANILISALFFLGLIFLVIGLIQFLGRSENNSIQFEKGDDVESAEVSSETKIKVDVSGEVLKPGVYTLDSDTRIQDALDKAGGLSSNADSEYISKSLNLASRLSDGMKIYIPAAGETPPLSSSNTSVISSVSNSGLISINSGTQGELESLPGIGPVTAGKIINARPYGSIQELLDKKAVGKSTFEKIKELVSL